MGQPSTTAVELRVEEKHVKRVDRTTKILLTLLVVGVWGMFVRTFVEVPRAEAQASSPASDAARIIRARGLVIVDENGAERIMIGSPVPDPKEGKRKDALTGIAINDPKGFERFGVGLTPDGSMQLGLDAPPGKGDDRNRERIHLIADEDGGAYIRFLNRKTSVPGWIRLGDDDKLYLEFLDVRPDKKKVFTRSISLDGEKRIEEPLK